MSVSPSNSIPGGAGSLGSVDANDAFDMGLQFEQHDDLPAAEQAYRAADQMGHAAAAVNLGVLLEERDDLAGAEQAFRRADQRGDATGAFHLGWLLQEGGDLVGAEHAYRRAELRGHPAAHANLRMMLSHRGRSGHGESGEAVDDGAGGAVNGGGGAVNGGGGAVNGGGGPAIGGEPLPEAPPGAPAATAAPPPAPLPLPIPVAIPTEIPLLPEEPATGAEEEPPSFVDEGDDSHDFAAEDEEPPAPAEPMALEEPGGPQMTDAAADALAAAVAAQAPATARRRTRGTRAQRKEAREREAGGGAERPETKASRAGLVRRTLGIGLPVAAFAAAFLAGVASRPDAPPPAHLTPASTRSRASATVSTVTSVPTPAKLTARHRPSAKKTTSTHRTSTATHSTATHSTASAAPSTSTAPVVSTRPPAQPQSPLITTNGSGGSAVSSSNGTGTTSGSG